MNGHDQRTLLVVTELIDIIERLTGLVAGELNDLPTERGDRIMTGVFIVEAGVEKMKRSLRTSDG